MACHAHLNELIPNSNQEENVFFVRAWGVERRTNGCGFENVLQFEPEFKT